MLFFLFVAVWALGLSGVLGCAGLCDGSWEKSVMIVLLQEVGR